MAKAFHAQPPYVLAAVLGDLIVESGTVTGIAKMAGRVTYLGDAPAEAQAVMCAPPTLFVMLAPAGLTGAAEVTVVHRPPPPAPALPQLKMSGELRGSEVRMTFAWLEQTQWPLSVGQHWFDVSFGGRVLTRVPMTVVIQRHLQ